MSTSAAEGMTQSIHDILAPPTGPAEDAPSNEELQQDRFIRDLGDILLEMKKAQDESNRNLLRQLQVHDDVGVNMATRVFDWMACKPDLLFFPVTLSPHKYL